MISRSTVRVVPADRGWQVIDPESGARRTWSIKRAAVDSAREMAKALAPSRLVVYRRDGSVEAEWKYSAEQPE